MTKNTHDSDVAFIRALAELLNENDLTELQVKRDYAEDDSLNVRVSRKPPQQVMAAPQAVQATAPVAATAPAAAVAAATEAAGSADPSSDPGAVTSPMVGTVYTAPEPDAPAFISEGDSVSQGQTILIVEAMKVMNPITAPKTGTVVKIFVQNAQPVEFGEALVIVE